MKKMGHRKEMGYEKNCTNHKNEWVVKKKKKDHTI